MKRTNMDEWDTEEPKPTNILVMNTYAGMCVPFHSNVNYDNSAMIPVVYCAMESGRGYIMSFFKVVLHVKHIQWMKKIQKFKDIMSNAAFFKIIWRNWLILIIIW